MDISQLTLDILNDAGTRKAIGDNIPGIARLEAWKGLKDLKLTNFITGDPLTLYYEARATSRTYYPDVWGKLVKDKVFTRDAGFGLTYSRGLPGEYVALSLDLGRNMCKAFLTVYNPKYRK